MKIIHASGKVTEWECPHCHSNKLQEYALCRVIKGIESIHPETETIKYCSSDILPVNLVLYACGNCGMRIYETKQKMMEINNETTPNSIL